MSLSPSLQLYHLKKKHDPEFIERRRQYGRQYYEQNKERLKQKSRDNKDKSLQHYHEKRKHDPAYQERHRNYMRQYYHRNKERLNAAKRDRRQAKSKKITPAEQAQQRTGNIFLVDLFSR